MDEPFAQHTVRKWPIATQALVGSLTYIHSGVVEVPNQIPCDTVMFQPFEVFTSCKIAVIH